MKLKNAGDTIKTNYATDIAHMRVFYRIVEIRQHIGWDAKQIISCPSIRHARGFNTHIRYSSKSCRLKAIKSAFTSMDI